MPVLTKSNMEHLQERFGLGGALHFERGQGGLTKVVMSSPVSTAELYLHGAHLTKFQPRGQENVLFTSNNSAFSIEKPIRGGVPICFPWFGPKSNDASAPSHGFARTTGWQVLHTQRVGGDAVELSLQLSSTDATRALWPVDFNAIFTVTTGKALSMRLAVTHSGSTPIDYEAALHTYLAVGDARQAEVTGLTGVEYLDKTRNSERFTQDASPIRFGEEVDRVYLNTTDLCVLNDPAKSRRISVAKIGSLSTVIWNPAPARAAKLADLGEENWDKFVCIETANAKENAVNLEPGETHTTGAVISIV